MRSANVTTFTPSSGGTPTPFQYIGAQQYQKDGDSGLSLVGNRYYDSDSGRFISQDPAQAGDNPYAYCDNNPLASTDPSGLDAQASGFGTPMRANLGDGGNGAPKTGSQYDPTPKPGTMGPPAPKPDTPKPDSKQKASPKPGWHPMPGYEWVPNPDRPGQWTMKPILPTLPEGTQNPISGPFPGNLPGPPSAPWRGTISGRGYSATGGYNPFNGDYGGVIHYDRWVAQEAEAVTFSAGALVMKVRDVSAAIAKHTPVEGVSQLYGLVDHGILGEADLSTIAVHSIRLLNRFRVYGCTNSS